MAFSVDNVGGVSVSTGGTSLTLSGFVLDASANLIMVGLGIGYGNADPMSVVNTGYPTWNGTAMTAVASSESDDANFCGVEWFYIKNPTTGTHDVVVDWGPQTNVKSAITVISFIDADVSGTTFGTASISTASATNPTVTVADSANGDIVVSIVNTDGSSSATNQAGTLIYDAEDIGSDIDINAQYQTATGTNTVCSWTNSTTDPYAASGVAVKGIAAAAGGNRFLTLLGVG